VKELIKHEEIEILDLDGITTEEEVLGSLHRFAGLLEEDSSVILRSLRVNRKDTKRATATLKSTDAAKLIKLGRITVCWVKAHVRLKIRATKCFKCLGHGHTKHV